MPFANAAPNLTTDVPALLELAKQNGVPICGKHFKTGQTFMKTLLAPGFKARIEGHSGWLSFYFEGPMTAAGLYPEHDIFIQLMELKNTLRWMQGEELITHFGLEYYN